MTYPNRKKLAKHFYNLGLKKHPYVLEMKKTKGDDPKTFEKEEPIEEIEQDESIKVKVEGEWQEKEKEKENG